MATYPASDYPGALDTDIPTIDGTVDNLNTAGKKHSDLHNALRASILALQANAILPLVHASGSYPARPSGVAVCHYFGPTVPTDWLSNDLWTDNT